MRKQAEGATLRRAPIAAAAVAPGRPAVCRPNLVSPRAIEPRRRARWRRTLNLEPPTTAARSVRRDERPELIDDVPERFAGHTPRRLWRW